MSIFNTPTKFGKASFDGQSSYDFEKFHLDNHGLLVWKFESPHRQDEIGPHFGFSIINSVLLKNAIFSHLVYDFELPCNYRFCGPVLGYVRGYSGYAAASSGGDQRPIEEINLTVDLSNAGLSIEISGKAGHIVEMDCCSKEQRFTKKDFAVSLLIDIPLVPTVVDIRTGANVFERRFLGTDVMTDVFPKAS